MWSVDKHFKFLLENNMDEKLYCAKDNGLNAYYPSHIIIRAQLANKLYNKTLLLANQLLLERIAGQKMIYTKSRKNQAIFNVTKDMQFGFLVHIRTRKMYLFIKSFIVHSLRLIDAFFCLFIRKPQVVPLSIINKMVDMIHFGLTKILFFFMVSTSSDWNAFSQIYDGLSYGVDMQINTNSRNATINKVVLSHLSFNFF